MGVFTTEEVAQRLAPCKIQLVGSWSGSSKVYEFKCSQGHTWKSKGINALSWKGCPNCIEKLKKKPKLTTTAVKARLAARGISLLGVWRGGEKKHKFKCSEGHQWSAKGSQPLYQRGCPECGIKKRRLNVAAYQKTKKLTPSTIKKRLKPLGLKLEGEWKGLGKTNTFTCTQGHTWETRGCVPLNQGRSCPYCNGTAKLTASDVKKRLDERGISIEGEWVNVHKKYHFTCSLGHQWEATGRSVLSQNRDCPQCTGHIWPEQLTRDAVVVRLALKGLRLDGPWNGVRKDATFRCNLDHTWVVRAYGPLLKGTGCPECYRLRNKAKYNQIF